MQERIIDFSVTLPKPYNELAYEVKKETTLQSAKVKGSNITYEWEVQVAGLNFSFNNTIGEQKFTPPSVGKYSVDIHQFYHFDLKTLRQKYHSNFKAKLFEYHRAHSR